MGKFLDETGVSWLIAKIKSVFLTTEDAEQVDLVDVDATPTANSTNLVESGGVYTAIAGKQDTLVSGVNIKTVNGESIVGSGNANVYGRFKGWWPDLATLKAAHTATEGDSAYVKDASPATTWSIYVYDSTASSDNYWTDSGTDADTSNVQTFASGEEVNETYIDDTHLDSPADGSLALAKDVKDFVFNDSAKTALVNLLSKVAFIDEHGQDYINTLYMYLFPNVVSIDAVFTQGQAVIYEDDELATLKQYLVVTALYQDGTTLILPSNAYILSGTLEEGQSTIMATYGDKSDTFIVTVSEPPREVLFGVFTDGYAVQKGLSDNIQKCFRFTASARAVPQDPCENRGYVFTVTDSSKYNIAIYDVQSLQKQTGSVPSQSVDGYYYLGGSKTISWKTQDSATTPCCWIALKKMDGTAFTAEELADGAAAVFTYTKNQ